MKFVHDYIQASVRQISTNTKQTPFEWHSSIKKTKLTSKEICKGKSKQKRKSKINQYKNKYCIILLELVGMNSVLLFKQVELQILFH